jgi:hypothetical protein
MHDAVIERLGLTEPPNQDARRCKQEQRVIDRKSFL